MEILTDITERAVDSTTGPLIAQADSAVESGITAARRSPTWAHVDGMQMIPIDQVVPSPYRVRLRSDPESLAPLVESLALGVQPIPPIRVRMRDGRHELLGGHRIVDALRHHLGVQEIAVIVMDVQDDLDAAYLVVGDNRSDYKDSRWDCMRAVGVLLAAGGERATQRQIARRNYWHQSDVSEWRYLDELLSPAVLKTAGVDEDEHAGRLRRLERRHFRALRGCASDTARAALLRDLVIHGNDIPRGQGDNLEPGLLFTMIVGGEWMGKVTDLAELSERQFRAVCRAVVQDLGEKRATLRSRRARRQQGSRPVESQD
jgi:ParB-like chromosome segregation protein Spo0J